MSSDDFRWLRKLLTQAYRCLKAMLSLSLLVQILPCHGQRGCHAHGERIQAHHLGGQETRLVELLKLPCPDEHFRLSSRHMRMWEFLSCRGPTMSFLRWA